MKILPANWTEELRTDCFAVADAVTSEAILSEVLSNFKEVRVTITKSHQSVTLVTEDDLEISCDFQIDV